MARSKAAKANRRKHLAEKRERGYVQFICSNCGAAVPWRGLPGDHGDEMMRSHDACPECEWSRHTCYGTDEFPPCGEMMEPIEFSEQKLRNTETGEILRAIFVVRRCVCGWEMTAPIQKHQRVYNGVDAANLVKLGADGKGRTMGSEFEEEGRSYVLCEDDIPENERVA